MSHNTRTVAVLKGQISQFSGIISKGLSSVSWRRETFP
jgi:hypothetical protein